MDNAGLQTIAVIDLTAALNAQAYTPIEKLDGMSSVTLEFLFQYGSGGASCIAKVQTSIDGGVTWLDVARADFANVSRAPVTFNLNAGGQSFSAAAYAALATEGINDGILGDRLRALVTSTGIFANTSLGIYASVR